MNKKTLSLTLGGALATSLLAVSPILRAGENPFGMSAIDTSHQVAAADEKAGEASCSAKVKEGKCGEGKCGANKGKQVKEKEGSCSAAKKEKEGSCSANKGDAAGKLPEGKCSATDKK
jgi:uncharacterized low-complexity protein